jgi:thiol-disulfide isomerase/thioredoxin
MFFPVVLALALIPQHSAQPSSTQDALALLTEVSQRYADAKSYHIEATEERTDSNELQRSWQKTLMKAIMMPGGRYRYEGRSGYGAAMYVSDGTTQWVYRVYEHLYTQKPAEGESPKHRIIPSEEMPALSAQGLVRIMAHRVDHLKSAILLPDEMVSVGGKDVSCYVVRYTDEDLKTKRGDGKQDWTLWISKQYKTVVKTLSHEQTYLLPARIPISVETGVVYEVAELDQQEPAESFTFAVPSDAKLVDEFPDTLRHNPDAARMLGNPAPELTLKSGGKALSLSSLRGKPVFLEFWATWCAPCVELIPDLKKLYAETQEKGLVWISIDSDHDASTVAAFLTREHVPWPNYHDEDGSLGGAYQRAGIPLGVLIDAEGKITFYESGYEIPSLRAAIAKLGPQFAGISPAAKPTQ